MAVIDGDAVGAEDAVHFTHESGTAGFDPVVSEHSVDVVGEEPVRVDDGLVSVHGWEVNARGQDDRDAGFRAGGGRANFIIRVGTGAKVGDTLDNGCVTCVFYKVQDEEFGGEDVVL